MTESPFISRRGKRVTLDPSMDRGEHKIDDELVFSSHIRNTFFMTHGVESGSTEELAILQEFIKRKCGERRLKDKLHAIWLDARMFTVTTTDRDLFFEVLGTTIDQSSI
ncbi:hypothetical protein EDB84DRAFT_978228 [Lactarius hengduanensis]|nr:hypothetical protein EDB84DRAFT_978228 [Lactarius hengduanensis]